MSSATSTDRQPLAADRGAAADSGSERAADQGISPWQFFLLLGMLTATAVVLVTTGQSPAAVIILSLTVIATSIVAVATYRSLAPLTGVQIATVVGAGDAGAGAGLRDALEREKSLVLRSLKELEFDRAMGKVAPADFDELNQRLRARAAGLLRQLDEGGYRSVIDREVMTRLAASEAASVAAAAVADVTREPGGVVNCSCGAANDADARFCKACGQKLTAA